jgi:SPP1 gp7 family putative phage head morphogenesis protein
MSSRKSFKRKLKGDKRDRRDNAGVGDMGREVSTVDSYLYYTRPYPFNPDEVVGKKGLRKYTEMFHDEQIKAAVMAKQFAVLGSGWEVAPASYEDEAESDAADELARFVEQNFDDMEGAFDGKLLEVLSAFVYGFSIAEKVFSPMEVGEFAGKIGLKDLKFRKPEGFDFRTDPYGNLLPDGVLQAVRPLPAEKFFIYSYRKQFSNLYGQSDLRQCYRAFWAKDNAIKFMMITLERYGEPTWIFNVKGAMHRGNINTLENFMKDIQSKSGLILPDNISAEPKHPAPEAAKNYIPILEYLDGLIRAALLMPSLIGPSSTEQKGGSYARAETQYDMFLSLMEYLRADVESALNEQVVKQLIDFNYEITDGKYPKFKFKAITAEEEQRQYDNFMKGIETRALSKTREDENYFRDKMGIPALPEDYPVVGEITPEIQAEQQIQAQALKDVQAAAAKNPQPPAGDEGPTKQQEPGAGAELPLKREPVSAAKKAEQHDGDLSWKASAWINKRIFPDSYGKIKIETLEDQHAREYIDYRDKQTLQNHLINIDRNCDLTGAEAVHVQTMMPKTISYQYMDVPGVDQMHKDMGMEPDLDTEPKKYHAAKAKLFNKQPRRRVSIDALTFTQTYVHKGRVEDMLHDAEALNQPVQAIKSGQSHYLMDGHHRVVARHQAGKKFTMAYVFAPPMFGYAEKKIIDRHDHAARVSTKYEQRVDFAQAKAILDKSELAIKERLQKELKDVERSTLKWVNDNGANLTSSQVADFKIEIPAEVQQTLKDMFETAWTDGRDAGVGELPPKQRKKPEVQDVKTFAHWDFEPHWAMQDQIHRVEWTTASILRHILYAKQEFADWNESLHPRNPAGSEKGGEFAPSREGESIWNSSTLTREQLDRAGKIGSEITNGPVSQFISNQMRGGILKNGQFTKFSSSSKQRNLSAISKQIESIKKTDPEAFENYRQWSVADAFGVKDYKDLSAQVSVFRGASISEPLGRMTNVSTSQDTAEHFGKVTEYKIDPHDIGHVMGGGSSFKEGELLIFNAKKLQPVKLTSQQYANAFEPVEALIAFENRAWLINDVISSDIQSQIRYELFEHLKGGRTLRETMDNMRQIFEPWVGDPSKLMPGSKDIMSAFRLENIIRTETTWAYNQGRLAIGDAAGEYILGYQFSAIIDDRTTETCRKADRLVLRKDAATTIKLIPPLHYQCRSLLVYVTQDDIPVEWSSEKQIDAAVELIPKGFK